MGAGDCCGDRRRRRAALLDAARAELLARRGGHPPARHALARAGCCGRSRTRSRRRRSTTCSRGSGCASSAPARSGLRSLSALAGTATIVVLALVARRAAGDRAGARGRGAGGGQPAADLVQPGGARLRAAGRAVRAVAVVPARARLAWLGDSPRWRRWRRHYFACSSSRPEVAWLALAPRARVPRGGASRLSAGALAGAALLPLAIVQAGGRPRRLHPRELAGQRASRRCPSSS